MSEQEPESEPVKDADGLEALIANHPDSIYESDDRPGVTFADLQDSSPDDVGDAG